MSINLSVPNQTEGMRPSITVVGVGGAGGNAVNNMIRSNLEGVKFAVANTDAQALENALTDKRIQLGAHVTQGLGAGAKPQIGRAAAEEAIEDIENFIRGSNMVFITAGMGGGTGTGAAPVVANLAREMGILTVGVVTKPFHFEGSHRMRIADDGLNELQQHVDTLIVIPNQNLFRIANEKTTFADAFAMADDVLHSGVRGVTDLMVMPGLINLDFADIRTVMSEMGKAMMGTGEAEGDRRAVEAAEAAISNPLLDDVSMRGARGVLINITGGMDLTLFEVDEAANRIREEVDSEANIIFGAIFNEELEGRMRVSVVATGVESEEMSLHRPTQHQAPTSQPTMQRFQPMAAPAAPARAPRPEPSAQQPEKPAAAPRTEPRSDMAGNPFRGNGINTAEAPQPAVEKTMAQPEAPEKANMQEAAPRQTMSMNEQPAAPQQQEPSSTAPAPFVPPKAVEPTIRPTEVKPAYHAPTSHQAQDDAEQKEQGSFFSRMGKAFGSTARPQDEATDQREDTAAQPTNRDDEYLDIPAFLRRQAN